MTQRTFFQCVLYMLVWSVQRLLMLRERCWLQALHQGLSAPAPQHVGSVLALTHFLDHMYHHRPAKRVEASPWFEAANNLVQELVSHTVQDAPKVTSRLQTLCHMTLQSSALRFSAAVVLCKKRTERQRSALGHRFLSQIGVLWVTVCCNRQICIHCMKHAGFPARKCL